MALSTAELELQAVEYLPAREVMSGCGRRRHRGGDVNYQDNDGVDQDQSGISLLSPQIGVGVSAFNSNG